MLEVMYDIPSVTNISGVHINEECITEGKQPVIIYEEHKEAS